MLTVYGSPLCPDCRECKVNFDAQGVAYEYVDITKNMRNLKAFLRLRDTLPAFDGCRELHSVGIPALVEEDGSITLDWEDWMVRRGLPVEYKEQGAACGIDGKGC